MSIKIEDILYERALDQHGYVTPDDAKAEGVDPFNLVMLSRRGRILHVAHGIYRFERFPTSPLAPFMEAVLWTGGGVISHDSALDLHDLCQINPAKIHLTIPGRRPRRPGGELIVTHRGNLEPDDVERIEGIPIVTPKVAIAQGIGSGVQTGLLTDAIDTARQLGRITPIDARALRHQLKAASA